MFEVRNEEVEQKLRELGQTIGKGMPAGYGFTLLIFSYSGGGPADAMFYISSSQREDMIRAMQEFIEKHREN